MQVGTRQRFRLSERQVCSHRHGFTLLETLLSLAIAVVVVALVYSVYHTVTQTLAGQQSRATGPERTAAIVQRIAEDLARTYLPEEDEACEFMLTQDPNDPTAISLSFCMLERNPHERDFRWLSVVQVNYHLADGEQGLGLARSDRPTTGPLALQPPATNQILPAVASFAAQVWDGEEWVNQWPPAEGNQPPTAVRLQLTMADPGQEPVECEVFIPAAKVYPGSLQRGASPR